ncbi:MAG: EI24 domain-containing protein [Propionibacteriaceae bacterium]
MAQGIGSAFSGIGLLLRGLGLITRRPKLFLLAAIPPLITSTLFVIALVALVGNGLDLAAWLSPFADGWSTGLAEAVRVLIGLALIAGAVLVMVVAFSTITLTLGGPIYDLIAESVESELGDVPNPREEKVAVAMLRSIRQSLVLILISLLCTVLFFAIGFIPVVGQVAAPILSACFGGWMIAIELIGSAFDRRGLLRLSERRRAMQQQRWRVLGFGIPTFLLLSVPFLSVVVFPAATAGGTLLARELTGTTAPADANPR